MAASVSDLRYAHPEGTCNVCYSVDGRRVLTGGADGEVRLYQDIEDQDNVSHLVGDQVLALACGPDKFYVAASGTNNVQSYSLDTGRSVSIVTKFAADATSLQISQDGKLLAAGSGDMTLQVVDTESFKRTICTGHEAPILSVALDNAKEFVVSSSCDGSVRIWSAESGALIKAFRDVLPKSNDTSNSLTRGTVAWHPKGSSFAVPLKGCVRIYARDSWETGLDLKPSSPLPDNELFTTLAWSPDGGAYLIAATTKGNMVIWRTKDGKIMAEPKTGKGYAIMSIAWHPGDKHEVAFIDDQGYWGVVQNVLFGEEARKAVPVDEENMNEDQLAAALFDDDDDDENSFSIRQIKRDTGFLSDEDSNMSRPESAQTATGNGQKVGEESTSAVPPPQQASVRPFEMDIQEPFQPGSTPSRLSSRFMVWNSVGTVRCFNTEEDSSIEVEFHDSQVHHPLHISNELGYTMADLCRESLVLACEANDEESSASKLVCHHFGSKEWSVEMPGKEEIMAVCCGFNWIAAATDRRRLRIFSAAGMQRDILSLPGPVVALAGHGPFLVVAVHLAMPLLGNQNIGFAQFNIADGRRHPNAIFQALPLAPNSILSWIGFSDEGTPCLVDSAGQVRIFNQAYRSWIEVCDTKAHTKGKSDHHFVVGINEQEHNIRSILCKGSRHPLTLPKPTLGVISMSMPLCESATEKGMLEEQLLKLDLQLRAVRNLESKGDQISSTVLESQEEIDQAQSQTLVKLFALACKADNESRALDVCRLMDTATIQIAIKYAAKIRRMQLANRLSDLACTIQDKEANEAEEKSRYESQDMFETNSNVGEGEEEDQQEEEEERNPILAAKMKKQAGGGTKPRPFVDSQGDSRNPFKKSAAGTPSGAIRTGLVFDDMACKAQPSKQSSEGFGSRTFGKITPRVNVKPPATSAKAAIKPGTLFMKKTAQSDGKENSTTHEDASSPSILKGFQLWLAENKACIGEENTGWTESEIVDHGLKTWASLSKEEKERYKSPRLPTLLKRRREDGEDKSSSSKSLKLSV